MDNHDWSASESADQFDYDESPFSEITQILAPDDVAELQRQFGGMSVYIAAVARPNSAITKTLGERISRTLSAHFHGEWVWIPSGRMELRRATAGDRAALIFELNKEGLIKRDIARRARCSERWVYKVLSGATGL